LSENSGPGERIAGQSGASIVTGLLQRQDEVLQELELLNSEVERIIADLSKARQIENCQAKSEAGISCRDFDSFGIKAAKRAA
jgi:hypothetical protein